MDIRPTDIARLYRSAQAATEPLEQIGSAGTAVLGAARDFTATLRNAEETAKETLLGQADPHALVEALAQTELAIETAVTLRNKVVEAYQEILRMPV